MVSNWKISAKLLGLNILVFLVLAGILAVVFVSFRQTQHTITTITQRDVTGIINNAQTGRELTSIFADLLTSIFYGDKDAGQAGLHRLDLMIQSLTGQDASLQLQQALQAFSQTLTALLDQSANLKTLALQFSEKEEDFVFNVEMLNDIMKEKIGTSNDQDPSRRRHLEQLQATIIGFRGAFNQIISQATELQRSKAFADPEESGTPSPGARALESLDYLLLRFQALTTTDDEDILESGQQLTENIKQYQAIVLQYQDAARGFQTLFQEVTHSKDLVITALNDQEARIVHTVQQMERALESENQRVSRLITVLAGVLGMVIVLSSYVVQKMVKPLIHLAQVARGIAEGDLEQEITIRQHDEIGELAEVFRTMKNTLSAVLGEIKTLILTVQHGKLDIRGETTAFHGSWEDLIVGINHVLDAFAAPLTQINQTLARLAQGDFTDPMRADYQGDFGVMMQQVRTMTEQLTNVVRNVKTATQDLAQRSREMNASAEQMSEGAEQQAAASEEVSASMQEMAANIRQTAENAKLTEQIARKSAEDAQAGKQAVTEIIQAMEVIADRISVVQEIAGQTNMLSLNATIEAARAQEYGKGFAVVAASVRDLARASRVAADEIRTLVHSCVVLSAQAGEVLQRLVPNSEKTAELVQEISAAAQEQSSGVEHVNQAVQQLDTVTQQNAATAEEVATTAESLTTQMETLQHTMAFFTVNETTLASHRLDDDVVRRLQELDKAQLATLLTSALFDQPQDANAARAELSSQTSSESRSVAHGEALDLEIPDAVSNDRDQEFERY